MTSVDQIRARVEAATPKPWKYDPEGGDIESGLAKKVWVAQLRAEPANLSLLLNARADLEYLLDLLDSTQEAMTERAVEADYWKKSAIGPVALQVITESSLLAAIVTGLGGETFVGDAVVHFAHHHQRVDVLYDAKREGTTVVVTE